MNWKEMLDRCAPPPPSVPSPASKLPARVEEAKPEPRMGDAEDPYAELVRQERLLEAEERRARNRGRST